MKQWITQCCSMTDYAFLEWIRDRLEFVHGEDPEYDYMIRLREIAQEVKRHYEVVEEENMTLSLILKSLREGLSPKSLKKEPLYRQIIQEYLETFPLQSPSPEVKEILVYLEPEARDTYTEDERDLCGVMKSLGHRKEIFRDVILDLRARGVTDKEEMINQVLRMKRA